MYIYKVCLYILDKMAKKVYTRHKINVHGPSLIIFCTILSIRDRTRVIITDEWIEELQD